MPGGGRRAFRLSQRHVRTWGDTAHAMRVPWTSTANTGRMMEHLGDVATTWGADGAVQAQLAKMREAAQQRREIPQEAARRRNKSGPPTVVEAEAVRNDMRRRADEAATRQRVDAVANAMSSGMSCLKPEMGVTLMAHRWRDDDPW